MSNEKNTPEPKKVVISRRRVLKGGAFLGSLMLGLRYPKVARALENKILLNKRKDARYTLAEPENILYSVCLNCNTGCGIKCKVEDGVLLKVDGNPYNPWNMVPQIPYGASLSDAARVDAALCPKGQASIQTLYDPYRLRKVLKRAGKRGENKWVSISFEQAIMEIAKGGKLFAHVPGEENRDVEGLRSIMALTDGAVAKAMAGDVQAIWDKKLTVAEFKLKHAAHLDKLIDPDHPDLGPKNNQFVMAWGRLKGGRSDFMKRFGAGFGTTNLHGHTTVCQGSIYFACKAISEQYEAGTFSGGQKFYWQADTENSEFVLFAGANLFEANYGPTNRTVRLTENLASGKTKIAVVDPRFSKLASKAWKWMPIKPGMDAALALAIGRWMLENSRYDAKFLQAANRAAAKAAGETSYVNATWLVKIDPKTGEPGGFVRAADVGVIAPEARTAKTSKGNVSYEERFMLVMQNGTPVAFDPNDAENPVTGDLFVDATLPDGTRVKSSLQLYRESTKERTIEEAAAMAGLSAADIIDVAKELSAHNKKAAVDIHRGAAQHPNGFYNVMSWMSLNMLLGNFDWKGGMSVASTYKYDKSEAFDLSGVPGSVSTFGISSIRHGVDYAKTTIFKGYPARRNWYPLSSDMYQEIIPSIGDEYPYPVKALFLYMGTPLYALPAGHAMIPILTDLQKLPLFFTSDITVGTTSMYADYIFPDLTYLERWEFHGSHPNVTQKVQPVRQPVVGPIPESCKVYGQEVPIAFETTLMGLAEALGLKAFGPGALGKGGDLNRPEDFYLRAVANLALGDKPGMAVSDATPEEIELFLKARRHLPKTVFDADYWRSLVGETLWPKVVYVLNRGGRFQSHADSYRGEKLGNPYGKLLCIYQEKTAKNRYAGTGKHYPGLAKFVPIADYHGNPVEGREESYDLQLITHRTITMTKSRTVVSPWLLAIMPENAILISPKDAARLGLQDGQTVRVVSPTNPEGVWDLQNGTKKSMEGPVKVTEGIRPGVISFVLGFGHWATGSADVLVDGKTIKGDPRRATGVHANAAMWTDPALKNTCLIDPVGGSVNFYSNRVKLLPV